MVGAFAFGDYKLSNFQYIAPELFIEERYLVIGPPSKASDVYSLAMTSFEVCPSTTNNPAT
jgi:hypothetical protein